jgi:ribosomal protein L29
MAKKKDEKFKGLSKEELKKNLISLEDSLRALRFKAEGAKSKNVKESLTLRKQIAQVKTEMNQVNK